MADQGGIGGMHHNQILHPNGGHQVPLGTHQDGALCFDPDMGTQHHIPIRIGPMQEPQAVPGTDIIPGKIGRNHPDIPGSLQNPHINRDAR